MKIASSLSNISVNNQFHPVTIVSPQPFIELNNQSQTLQFSLQKESYCLGRDCQWSDLDIPEIGWEVLSRRQAILKKEGEEYRIYDGDGKNPSRNGIFINHTRISSTQGYLLKHGEQLEIGQDFSNRILLTYCNPVSYHLGVPSKVRLVLKSLKQFPVELGRAIDLQRYSSVQLDSPVVSRRHATIYPDGRGGYILQDYSTNGTFVNGDRIDKPVCLKDRDTIQIGPFTLVYRQDVLELLDLGNQIRLDAHHLLRQVKDKDAGEKTILNNVSLAIEPGQLVALVGGSGTGKSTLMKTLLGIEPTTSGTVFLNGDDLRQHFDIYRLQIGYVPQDDIVHRDLRVEEVLTYACQLRLPPDTDVEQMVGHTLEQIKLSHVKDTFVRNLSGGQRKRVSIGVELLADPKLFFLDEPTSGLDPGLDKEMMKLLRELADQGRTVILVTHATANIEVCDRIVFMGRGGKLCYFGSPQAALQFFEMPANDLKYFADIYIRLDQGKTKQKVQENINYWAEKLQNLPQYQAAIQSSLSPAKASPAKIKPAKNKGISPLRQLLILSRRHLQLVRRDRVSLSLALLTGPIGIALIELAVENEGLLVSSASPDITQASLALRVLFIFSCIAIWVGLSSSVQELVKESAIYLRERLVNLGLIPYLGSKIFIRSGIAVVQTLLIILATLFAFKSPDSNLITWQLGLGITNFLTLLASISLGLMLSAFVRYENEANNTLPLVMIPQIIFSGALFDLEGLSSKISWLMLSRWSVGAYGSLIDVNAMVPNLPQVPRPFEANLYESTWGNLSLNWGMLCLHTLIYLIVAAWLQKRKDIF